MFPAAFNSRIYFSLNALWSKAWPPALRSFAIGE